MIDKSNLVKNSKKDDKQDKKTLRNNKSAPKKSELKIPMKKETVGNKDTNPEEQESK